MKIELNGPAVASFFVGVVLGAIGVGAALAIGPINRMQQERDHNLAVINEQRTNIAQLQGFIAASQRKQQAAAQPVSPQPQDPAVEVLNAVHPGLGTVAAALSAAVQKSQAEKEKQLAPIQQAAAEARPGITTALSDSCGPNQILITLGNGPAECDTCYPGLHPGKHPDGTVGCVQ